MATVIKFMLQLSPSYRPSCDQILALPIVESLSKKFFPDHISPEESEETKQALLKTIRISRNLFSLTERLPKSKYRGRSNEIMRQNSAESQAAILQNAGMNPNGSSTFKLKTLDQTGNSPGGKQSSASNKRRGRSLDELPGISGTDQE